MSARPPRDLNSDRLENVTRLPEHLSSVGDHRWLPVSTSTPRRPLPSGFHSVRSTAPSPKHDRRLRRSLHAPYRVRIRPARDNNGTLFGYYPSFEPLLPISGGLERAERAVLRAIERITGTIPVYDEPIDASR